MAELVYNKGREGLATGRIALTTDGTPGAGASTVLGVMLVTTGYLDLTDATIIDKDFLDDGTTDDPASYEIPTTSNYARATLGARTVTEDDTGNNAYIDVADVTFSSVSSGAGVIGAAIIFSPATSETVAAGATASFLVAKYDTGFPVTPNGGDITIQWSTGGILQFTT